MDAVRLQRLADAWKFFTTLFEAGEAYSAPCAAVNVWRAPFLNQVRSEVTSSGTTWTEPVGPSCPC